MVGKTNEGLDALQQFYLLLPILVSSATLIQLPAASVHLSNKWRAIQLYDSQEVNEEEKAKFQSKQKLKKNTPLALFYGLLTFTLILGPEVFLLATEGRKLCPTLTFLRDHVVHFYLCFFGLPLVVLWLIPTSHQNVFVSRAEPKFKSRMIAKTVRNFKLKIPSLEFFSLFLIPTVFVFLTFYLPVETLIIPTFVAILVARGLIREPLTFRKYSSFRGLFLGPIIYLMLCAALGSALVALVILYKSNSRSNGMEPTKSSDLDPKPDQALEALFTACRPYLWLFCNFVPAALICLAYRYDSINAGYSLIGTESTRNTSIQDSKSEDDTTEVINVEDVEGQSISALVLKEYDGQGKRAVQLSSVSIPRLPINQTPIFNVGMLVFLLTHIGSIILALSIPSNLTIVDGSFLNGSEISAYSSSRVALESVFSAFPPGWPATLLVPLAMLIRAHFTEHGMNRLWNYNEKWQIDQPKKAQEVESKATGEKGKDDEGQSLLADFE